MFCFLDSCFQHEDILCDFITNLGTTILQKELVFFVHNVRCFLKQKTLRCFSGGSVIIPFSTFFSTQKVCHSLYSLFTEKDCNCCGKQGLFLPRDSSVCGCVHISTSRNILTVPFNP